jgi:uncharacterized protein DUF6519
MGNFSRPPQDRLQDSVAKHYVGVRLQQGVPLLDADWNELEDLRRYELETLGTWFIGDGVPVGSDGFHVFPVNAANDFGIRQGTCIVRGKVTVNDAEVRYTTQPHFGDPNLNPPVTALSTPGGAAELIVYLDVTELEVNSGQDPEMMEARIGMETTVRVKRDWVVRVAVVPNDLALLDNPPAGHLFYRLARLRRFGGNDKITGPMIEDLRDTQLSIRRRIEVRNNLGTLVVDNDRFRALLETTRNNVLAFVRYITTEFNPIYTPMTAAEVLGIQAATHITRPAEAGLALLGSHVIANQGALGVISQLYESENAFLGVWRDVVLTLGGTPKKYNTYANFLDRLDHRLHDTLLGADPGLLPALQAEDLAAATTMQEEIARLFGEASASLPRGSIVVFLSKSPAGNLTQGQTVTFEFTVQSFTTLADTYTVKILPATGWTRRVVDSHGDPVPANRVSIGPGGTTATIFVEVQVATGSSDLQLEVSSDHNPLEVTDTTDVYSLTEGAPAPGAESQIRLQITGVSGTGAFDEVANTLTLPATGATNISARAWNDSDGQVSLALTQNIQNAVGTWSASFPGGTPIQIPAHDFTSFTVRVTPGTNAASAKLVVTGTATIGGNAVTAKLDPDLQVS